MKTVIKHAARLLIRTADTMQGYVGQELERAALIACTTVPICWIGIAIFVQASI